MNATSYLLNNGSTDERIALVTLQDEHSYGDLRLLTRQVAAWLMGEGAAKGERVVLIGDSDLFWAGTYLGSMQAGCVSVPLPVNMEQNQVRSILQQTRPAAVFIQARYLKRYLPVLEGEAKVVVQGIGPSMEEMPFKVVPFTEIESLDNGVSPDERDVDEAKDLAALMFTSGSTGDPRGVMISHRNIMANTDSIIEYLSLDRSDRMMAVLPFYYCFGTSLLHTHLRVGGSVVYDGRFMYPDKVLERMIETGCTGFAGVPSTYMILLRTSNMANMSFPCLKHVQQAGGKLPNVHIAELRKVLPGISIFIMYGQTEATARLSYLPPEELDRKQGSIGKGIPGVNIRVVDGDGRPCPPGVAGEIFAKGDNIGLGYWDSPEETCKAFRDGGLYTGDLAVSDEEDYITIVDRARDFLKCGGIRASSKEIEDRIYEFEGTVEAAVIGQPDDALGEAVRLYIVHNNGKEAESDLKTFCGKNLPWQLVPRTVVFLDTMPKNSSGKVDKPALRKRLSLRA